MKYLLLVVLSFSLIGCASRYKVEPPVIDYLEKFEMIEEETEIVVFELPPSPKIRKIEHEGESYAAFDLAGLNSLSRFRDNAKKNTMMLDNLIMAYNATLFERNAMLGIARELEKRANVIAVQWANTESAKKKAEDYHFIERSIYQILLVLSLVL